MKKYFSPHEQSLIIDGLLLKISELEKTIENLRVESNSRSVFISFIDEKHPEIIDDLIDFVKEEALNNVFGDKKETKEACLCALQYYEETLDSKHLDEVIETIKSI